MLLPISAAEAYETYASTYDNTMSIINNEIDRKAQKELMENYLEIWVKLINL